MYAMTDEKSPIDSYFEKIASASSVDDLNALEQELFGRKNGVITIAMKELKDLDGDEKMEYAKKINAAKKDLTVAVQERHDELTGSKGDSLEESDSIDVTLDLPKKELGHLHLIPEFIAQVEEVFGRMGFDVWSGPELEDEELNFDLLNIPKDHPARDTQDTFWVGDKVLRTHTSPVQIRYMREHEPPFRAIFPGKVYRKDADATHSPMFHQFEGLMIGEDISIGNLKAVLITAMKELISDDVVFRFRTGFFPFTEPSLEMDMQWKGDEEASREGKWLEMGGMGMVHPNVLRNVNIDPQKYQGFAFGFGIERPLMIKHQIPDLRAFFQGDLRFLKQY